MKHKHYTYKRGYVMNNIPDAYEEYLMFDREYRYYEALEELRLMYINNTTIDRDDMEYPPMWEPGL